MDAATPATITRREAVQRVRSLIGGAALAGGDRLVALSFDVAARDAAMAQGVGAFTAADVALLDEIAETILPGDIDARRQGRQDRRLHGADGDRRLHRRRAAGVPRRPADSWTRRAGRRHGVAFMQATPAQRLTLLEALDREQKTAMDARIRRADPARAGGRRPRRRAGALFPHDEGAGAARLLHLRDRLHEGDALPRVARSVRSGAPHAPGDKSWAAARLVRKRQNQSSASGS